VTNEAREAGPTYTPGVFEAAELGVKVDKDEYKEQARALRVELLRHQFELRAADFPVILVLAGDDRLACEAVLRLLHVWLDPRFLETNVFGRPTDEEAERPIFWRYWRRLPPRGRIGVFLGAWNTMPILARIRNEITDLEVDRFVNHILRFEQGLADDGAVVEKFWLHLPKGEHRKRLEKARKDELAWHLRDLEREIFENFDEGIALSERVVRLTSTGRAPWHIVESTDWRARNLSIARELLKALSKRLQRPPPAPEPETIALAQAGAEAAVTILSKVDLSRSLDKDEYEDRFAKEQRKIAAVTQEAYDNGVSSVLVFEGWDAAGKGGAVRRLTAAMDPSLFHVVPIAAPTEEERAHHYLWRFWRYLPRRGEVTIYDRSWYGRVLVERVEGFASRDEWRRAYREINDFEEQLCEAGYVVQKFWLHIDRDEQIRRFQDREQTPFKEFKISEEDYRNREHWAEYELAVNEMVARTSTEQAPWTIVPANDKRYARIEVLNTFRKRLEERV